MHNCVRVSLLTALAVLTALCLLSCGGGGGGGGGAGTIEGTVTVALTGDPIANATVSVAGTTLTDTTDAEGRYSISGVAAGVRALTATAAGYHPQTRYADVPADAAAGLDLPLPPTSHTPTTYYVATTGSDSNVGSQAQPWATPGYGARQLLPGDTLLITQGEYVIDDYGVDDVVPEFSGVDGAWITLRGEPGAEPVLRGANAILSLVEVGGRSHIRLENLKTTSVLNPWTGGARGGIEAGGSSGFPASDIEIVNVEVYDVEEAGINLAGNIQNVTMENVHVHHTGGPGVSAPSAQGGAGWQNVLIEDCVLEYAGMFYNGQEQPSGWPRPDGLGMEGSEGPLEVSHTISRYNFGDGLDSKTKNTYIHHCVVANNYGDGVKMWGDGSRLENTLIFGTSYVDQDETTPWCLLVVDSDDPGAHIEVTNCTMFDDDNRANPHYAVNSQVQYTTVPITLVFRNNIVSGLSRMLCCGGGTLTAQNNLFYLRKDPEDVQVEVVGQGNYTAANIGTLGSGNLCGDPLFVQGEWGPNGDFHLQNGSPAIDTGLTIPSITDDLVGTLRPQGAHYDLGAYER
jgi:hypothetical protein